MRILDIFSKREHALKNWDIILKKQALYIKQNKINATKEAETKGLIWLKKGMRVDRKKNNFDERNPNEGKLCMAGHIFFDKQKLL